jgi:phospholipase/carboxylesterase
MSSTTAHGRKAERIIDIAGLQTTVVGITDTPLTLVLLHGYAMRSTDLAPFAHSLGLPALFLLPQGPVTSPNGGHAWWTVDPESREAALRVGPRDLVDDYPQGLAAARHHLGRFLTTAAEQFKSKRIILGGFSQGGMLALDWALRGDRTVDGLLLLSASRLAIRDWDPRRPRLRNLPIMISHGAADTDLAFSAGERLRDFLLASQAQVTWVPFEGGHEIPLIVWRGIRKFLADLT